MWVTLQQLKKQGDEGSEAMKGRGEGEASEETNLVLVS